MSLRIPTPHLQQYGIVEAESDFFRVSDLLEKEDPNLDLGWVEEAKRYVIVYLIPDGELAVLKVIQDEQGNFRQPTEQDVKDLQEGRYLNDVTDYWRFKQNKEKADRKAKSDWHALNKELAQEAAQIARSEGPHKTTINVTRSISGEDKK
jgi:hypothetical protein